MGIFIKVRVLKEIACTLLLIFSLFIDLIFKQQTYDRTADLKIFCK